MQITKMEELNNLPARFRANVHYANGHVSSRRILIENNSFAVYAKRSRTRGSWHYGFHDIVAIEPITESVQPDEVKWEKSWRKALKMLNESGLWEDIKQDIEIILSIGYEKVNMAYDASDEMDMTEEDKIAKMKAIDSRLILTNEEGKEFVNRSILWYMTVPAKIKKMYFGRSNNEFQLARIAECMAKKEKHSTSGRASYDVKFEYNPEINKAWYSEEYRGCGNGHYYLALNATHALFCEDD